MAATAALLRFDAVVRGTLRLPAARLATGATLAIVAAGAEVRRELFALVAGAAAPDRGRLWLFGEDLYALPEAARTRLFERVGVVPEQGGLVSNLKVWENLLLPLAYHRGASAAEAEPRVRALFAELGWRDETLARALRQLPDRLTLEERRAVALVRAWLLEPALLIYDGPFGGLERGTALRWLRAMRAYQHARPDRASLYILPDEPFSAQVEADQTVAVEV